VTFEDRVRYLTAGLRDLLTEREQLAETIVAEGRPDMTMWPPSGPRLLSRLQDGRRTWFALHAGTLWYVRNGAGGTRHSFGVDRTEELDRQFERMVGRLACYRAEAWILMVDWPGLVRRAARSEA
jgi:hypothetical protein